MERCCDFLWDHRWGGGEVRPSKILVVNRGKSWPKRKEPRLFIKEKKNVM